MFTPDTLSFLAELEAHNEKSWFDANRKRYEQHFVAPGKALVEAVSARVGLPGKAMRIFRDVRFSKDKTPYKPHLDTWWASSTGEWGPGLFARLRPGSFLVGVGCHGFDKPALASFRAAVAKDGAALERAVGTSEVGGSTLKRMPKGYPEHPYMLHTGFWVSDEVAPPSDPVEHVVARFERWRPVREWLCGALG